MVDPLCSLERESPTSPSAGPRGRDTEQALGVVAPSTALTEGTPTEAERSEGYVVTSPPEPHAEKAPTVQAVGAVPPPAPEVVPVVVIGVAPEVVAVPEASTEAAPDVEAAARPVMQPVAREAPRRMVRPHPWGQRSQRPGGCGALR